MEKVLKISRPAPGQNMVVAVGQAEEIKLGFDLEGANLVVEGPNLIITFEDGASLTLAGMVQAAYDEASAPLIIEDNGSAVSAYQLLVSLEGAEEALETAAGAANGGDGGSGEYRSDPGDMYGSLDRLGVLDATSDRGRFPETEREVQDVAPEDQEAAAADIPALTAVAAIPPTGPVTAAAIPPGPGLTPPPLNPGTTTPPLEPGVTPPTEPGGNNPGPALNLQVAGLRQTAYEDAGNGVNWNNNGPGYEYLKGQELPSSRGNLLQSASHTPEQTPSIVSFKYHDQAGNQQEYAFKLAETSATVQTKYGQLTVNTDGQYVYNPEESNPAVQELLHANQANDLSSQAAMDATVKLTDNFEFTAQVGQGANAVTSSGTAELNLIPNKLLMHAESKPEIVDDYGLGHDVLVGDPGGSQWTGEPQNYNMTFIFDTSASMAGNTNAEGQTTLDVAVDAFKTMMGQLQQYVDDGKGSIYASFVTFNSNSRVRWHALLEPGGDILNTTWDNGNSSQTIGQILDNLTASTITNYSAGFNEAANLATANAETINQALGGNYENMLYMITDGMPNRFYVSAVSDMLPESQIRTLNLTVPDGYSPQNGQCVYYDSQLQPIYTGSQLYTDTATAPEGAAYRLNLNGDLQKWTGKGPDNGWNTLNEGAVREPAAADPEIVSLHFETPVGYVPLYTHYAYYDASGHYLGADRSSPGVFADGEPAYRLDDKNNLEQYDGSAWQVVKADVPRAVSADSFEAHTYSNSEVTFQIPAGLGSSGYFCYFYDADGQLLTYNSGLAEPKSYAFPSDLENPEGAMYCIDRYGSLQMRNGGSDKWTELQTGLTKIGEVTLNVPKQGESHEFAVPPAEGGESGGFVLGGLGCVYYDASGSLLPASDSAGMSEAAYRLNPQGEFQLRVVKPDGGSAWSTVEGGASQTWSFDASGLAQITTDSSGACVVDTSAPPLNVALPDSFEAYTFSQGTLTLESPVGKFQSAGGTRLFYDAQGHLLKANSAAGEPDCYQFPRGISAPADAMYELNSGGGLYIKNGDNRDWTGVASIDMRNSNGMDLTVDNVPVRSESPRTFDLLAARADGYELSTSGAYALYDQGGNYLGRGGLFDLPDSCYALGTDGLFKTKVTTSSWATTQGYNAQVPQYDAEGNYTGYALNSSQATVLKPAGETDFYLQFIRMGDGSQAPLFKLPAGYAAGTPASDLYYDADGNVLGDGSSDEILKGVMYRISKDGKLEMHVSDAFVHLDVSGFSSDRWYNYFFDADGNHIAIDGFDPSGQSADQIIAAYEAAGAVYRMERNSDEMYKLDSEGDWQRLAHLANIPYDINDPKVVQASQAAYDNMLKVMTQEFGEMDTSWVGINVSGDPDNPSVDADLLAVYDASHKPVVIEGADDLIANLAGTALELHYYYSNQDRLNGGEGNDVTFGDVINTDHLNTDYYQDGQHEGMGLAVLLDYIREQQGIDGDWILDPNQPGGYASMQQFIEQNGDLVRAYIQENHTALAPEGAEARGNADILMGGGGNDVAHGQGGSDVVFGGALPSQTMWNLYLEAGRKVDSQIHELQQAEAAKGTPQAEVDALVQTMIMDQLMQDIKQGVQNQDETYAQMQAGQADDGVNLLSGGTGSDILIGGADKDVLVGNEGNDLVFGGRGSDVMYGNEGDDTFLFGNTGLEIKDGQVNAPDNWKADTDWIMDFGQGNDAIDLSGMLHSLGFDPQDASTYDKVAIRVTDIFPFPEAPLALNGVHTADAATTAGIAEETSAAGAQPAAAVDAGHGPAAAVAAAADTPDAAAAHAQASPEAGGGSASVGVNAPSVADAANSATAPAGDQAGGVTAAAAAATEQNPAGALIQVLFKDYNPEDPDNAQSVQDIYVKYAEGADANLEAVKDSLVLVGDDDAAAVSQANTGSMEDILNALLPPASNDDASPATAAPSPSAEVDPALAAPAAASDLPDIPDISAIMPSEDPVETYQNALQQQVDITVESGGM